MKVTGGGKLTDLEKRIIESPLYSDIVAKLGVAITGNQSRFDSDHVAGTDIAPPTNRLKRIMSTEHRNSHIEDVEMVSNSASYASLLDDDNNYYEASTSTQRSQRRNSFEASTSTAQRRDSPEASTSSAHLRENPPSNTPAKVSNRRVTFDTMPRKRPSSAASQKCTAKRSKRGIQDDNIQQLNENLKEQHEAYTLQKEYWKLQVQRAEEGLNRDKLETQLVQINMEKATELKTIEVNKQKWLAKMEIEARRRELNLPSSFFDEDTEMI